MVRMGKWEIVRYVAVAAVFTALGLGAASVWTKIQAERQQYNAVKLRLEATEKLLMEALKLPAVPPLVYLHERNTERAQAAADAARKEASAAGPTETRSNLEASSAVSEDGG